MADKHVERFLKKIRTGGEDSLLKVDPIDVSMADRQAGKVVQGVDGNFYMQKPKLSGEQANTAIKAVMEGDRQAVQKLSGVTLTKKQVRAVQRRVLANAQKTRTTLSRQGQFGGQSVKVFRVGNPAPTNQDRTNAIRRFTDKRSRKITEEFKAMELKRPLQTFEERAKLRKTELALHKRARFNITSAFPDRKSAQAHVEVVKERIMQEEFQKLRQSGGKLTKKFEKELEKKIARATVIRAAEIDPRDVVGTLGDNPGFFKTRDPSPGGELLIRKRALEENFAATAGQLMKKGSPLRGRIIKGIMRGVPIIGAVMNAQDAYAGVTEIRNLINDEEHRQKRARGVKDLRNINPEQQGPGFRSRF